ncbi:hypothetical protein [Stenotrophomonas phage RAS14]
MNNKQIKRLRRLGLDNKNAKRAFHTLTHDQKQSVLENVAHIQMMEKLQANMEKLQETAEVIE